MELNKKLIEDFKGAKVSKLLAVTKYWEREEIDTFMDELWEDNSEILVWFWENRLNSIKEKKLERDSCHFIGNIQTKEIKHILLYCSTIHSVDNAKQIKKIEDICWKQDNWVKIFLQIKLDENKPWWIDVEKIEETIALIDECENISLIWFSAIWKAEFTREEKVEEFKFLKRLRTKYLPHWLISAWTSRDYEIAIEEEIDIVRVWRGLTK